jgi:putative PIN family toxin of toxin-antitoxin system
VKIFLDTNVLVSAVATRGLCADVFHTVLAEHQLIVGEAVLAELRRVLRQKIRLSADAIEEMDTFIRRQALVVTGAPPLRIKLRDPNDRAVLAEAVAGGADVLVTGDQDLLTAVGRSPLPIVTPRGLWEILRGNPDAK